MKVNSRNVAFHWTWILSTHLWLALRTWGPKSHCALLCLVTQSCLTLCNPMECSPPGPSRGGESMEILQARILGIFPTQELNPGLPHCRGILYQLSHKGSPRIQEWVAYPFSSRSSRPRIKPGSPALQADSLPAESQGKPKNTWVGSPSLLQGSSPPRNGTQVSCIAGGFFTNWAIREVLWIGGKHKHSSLG